MTNARYWPSVTPIRARPRLLIGGYGFAGKDTLADWLSAHTLLKHPGSTSVYLLPYVVMDKLGVTYEEACSEAYKEVSDEIYINRHNERELWFNTAHKIRDDDPAFFVDMALLNGDMVVGVRDIREIKIVDEKKKVDLKIWVANNRVDKDFTVQFGPEHCDIIIENNGTFDEFYNKAKALCAFACIPVIGY